MHKLIEIKHLYSRDIMDNPQTEANPHFISVEGALLSSVEKQTNTDGLSGATGS